MEYKTYCISVKCKVRDKCTKNYYTLVSKGFVFTHQVKLVVNNCEGE